MSLYSDFKKKKQTNTQAANTSTSKATGSTEKKSVTQLLSKYNRYVREDKYGAPTQEYLARQKAIDDRRSQIIDLYKEQEDERLLAEKKANAPKPSSTYGNGYFDPNRKVDPIIDANKRSTPAEKEQSVIDEAISGVWQYGARGKPTVNAVAEVEKKPVNLDPSIKKPSDLIAAKNQQSKIGPDFAKKLIDKRPGQNAGYYEGNAADAIVPAAGIGTLDLIRQTANTIERLFTPDQTSAYELTDFNTLSGEQKQNIIDKRNDKYRPGATLADKALLNPITEMRKMQDLEDESFGVQAVAGAAESMPQMATMALFAGTPAIANALMFNSSYNSTLEEVQKEHQAQIDAAKKRNDTAEIEALQKSDPLKDGKTWIRAIGSGALEVATERTFDLFAGIGGASRALQNAGADGLNAAVKTAGRSIVEAFTKESAEKLFAPTLGNLLIFLAKKGAEEGTEEIVSELGNGLIAKLTTNPNDKLFGELITLRGTALAFASGAIMGGVGSFANTVGQFANTRNYISKYTGLNINEIEPKHIQGLVDQLNKDMEDPANQQAVIQASMQTVAQAQQPETVQMQGVSGPVDLTAAKTQDGQVELSLDGKPVQTITKEQYKGIKKNGTVTKATPAVTPTSQAVDDSNLPVQTAAPVTDRATAQAQTQQMAGAAPATKQATYAGKNGKQVPVRSYVDGKTAVVEVSEPGTPVKHRIEFDPAEYQAAENKRLFLISASAKMKSADGKPRAALYQMVNQYADPGNRNSFYDAITTVADGIVSEMATMQQAATKPVAAPKMTAEESAVQAEKAIEKETKGLESRDMTEQQAESVKSARQIAREAQIGKVDKAVLDGLSDVDADLDRKGIAGYFNLTPAHKMTASLRAMQKVVEDTTGKRVVFVYPVGAADANEFVTRSAKDIVFVNSQKAAIPWAIGHGMYHLMVKDGTNAEFEQAALASMGKTREQLIEDTIALYDKSPAHQEYLRNNPDAAFEEAIADRAGETFATSEFWQQLDSQGTIGQKIMKTLQEWLERIKKTVPVTTKEVDAILKAIAKASEQPAATVKATEAAIALNPIKGIKTQTAKGPNDYIDVQFAVVDASSLIASHDLDGNENPAYLQELQPRDRSRVDSKMNITKIINDVDPRLLVGNESVKNGAPIIGNDGMVESGNGRIIGIKEFYQRNNASAAKYKQFLKQHAINYGIELSDWPDKPVLVRLRLSDVDRKEFTRLANVSEQAAMSPTEQAKSDAGRLTAGILRLFEANESGEINTAANRDFIREFIGRVVPSTERGTVIQDNGSVSASGISRIRNAMFYKAYGNLPLMDMVAESTDTNIKKILNSMVQAVPKIINAQEHIKNGTMFDMDIAQDLSAAAEKYATLIVNRKSGMDPVDEYVRQVKFPGEEMNLVAENLLKILHVYRNSGVKLSSFLNDYYDGIGKLGNPSEQSLFGETYKPNRDAYIDNLVIKELEKNGKSVEESADRADLLPLFEYANGTQEDVGVHEATGEQAESQKPEIREEVTTKPSVKAEAQSKSQAISDYEQKRLDKAERLRELAAKARSESTNSYRSMRNILDNIPLGQPILVGHHSEKHARADQARMDRYMSKSVEAADKAEYYERRAKAAENNKAISMDDPAAVEKLTAKVAELEAQREKIKATNAKSRAEGKDQAPAYMLQNLGANIRATKLRLEQAKKLEAKRTHGELDNIVQYFDGFDLVENVEANRIQLVFDGKPPADTIALLKSHGFRWSPSEGAWQRQLNGNGKYATRQVLKELGVSESDVKYSLRDEDSLIQDTLDGGEQPKDKGIRAHKGNRAFTEEYLQKPTLNLLTDAHKYYKVQGNPETIQNAAAEIDRNERLAFAKARNENDVSPENTALRLFFMRRADLRGDYQEAADWAFVFNKSNMLAGRAIQANVILKKMSVEANKIYAQRVLLGAIDAGKQAEIKEQAKGIAEELRRIDEGVSEYIFESVDDIMRVLKEPDLYERIRQYMSEDAETAADPVKDFIDALHGVLSATRRYNQMPNTADPVAFMKWVTANKDMLTEDIKTAYEIMSNLSGDDPMTMAEIQAYFRGIMPPAIGIESTTEVTPELQAQINKALFSHFKEDIRTFNAMVRRLIDLGVNPADATLIARSAQKQIARLTREEKMRAVRKLMPTNRRTESFLIKLVNMSNQKGVTDNDIATFIAQAQGLPGMDPDMVRDIMEWSRQIENINEQATLEDRTLTYEEERYQDIMMGLIKRRISMSLNVKLGQKIDFVDSMFLMSTPKTSMRNIVGNLGFGLVDLGKDFVEAGIDGVMAKFTGKHITGAPDAKALAHGFIRGIKESTYDITHGIYTAGINTGWDAPRGIILKSKPGQAATMLFRLAMELPDRAFQTAYYESSLAAQQRMHKTTEITDDMREVALYEAMRKTFADDNILTESFGKFRRGLNKFSTFGKSEYVGLGSLIVKFSRVPANLLMRTIEYSPVSFFRALYYLGSPIAENKKNRKGYWANFEQKKFTTTLANGTYGSAMTIGVGLLLTSLGLMTGRPEDDEDKRAALDSMGIGRGYMMNWSGLWRFLISGLDGQAALPQPGDTWSTYAWFSPMNIGIGIGANIVQDTRDLKAEDTDKVGELLSNFAFSAMSGVESITEMSLLSGIKNFMNDMVYSKDIGQALIKSVVGVPSRVVPNIIKSVAEMTDNTYRNTYSKDLSVYAYNLLKNKIPGAKPTLPPNVDMLGNLKELYQANGNNLFNVFFNPANVYKYQPNEAAIFALSVMAQAEDEGIETGRLVPEQISNTIKYKEAGEPVTLTDHERATLTAQIRKAALAEWAKIPADLPVDDVIDYKGKKTQGKISLMNSIQNDVAKAILKAYQAKKLAEKAILPK